MTAELAIIIDGDVLIILQNIAQESFLLRYDCNFAFMLEPRAIDWWLEESKEKFFKDGT